MSLKNNKESKTTEISKIGEIELINRIKKKITVKQKSTIKGIGDDSAVVKIGDRYQLISTDMLVEGVHFDLSYTPLKHLGYKSISVNISDICAMNGVATKVLVSIAVSNRFSVEAIEELYSGINSACDKYNIDLIGGDTTSSLKGLVISVTVFGLAEKEKITYRSGANPNDLVVVTGDLGAAYLGLQILKREKEIFLENPSIQPDLEGNNYVLERQLKPNPGVKYLEILKELNITPTSMIDISDSLASECLHLARSSGLGINIYEEKIPIDYTVMNLAREFRLNPIFCALNGGEEYELLFTIKQEEYKKLEKDVDFTIIGHMSGKEESSYFITKDSNAHVLTAQGWDSLKETL